MNDFITCWYFDYEDAKKIDRMGTTLVNLGFVEIFDVAYREDEEVEDGCRCGGCKETVRELDLHVQSKYDELYIDEIIRV